MAYKLLIEKYGKISKAEIEITPLTLFVGDNNSGKSYLLSLIWAISSGKENNTIYQGLKELLMSKYPDLYWKICNSIEDVDIYEEKEIAVIEEKEIVVIINELLNVNKEKLVRSIYNYDGMSVGKIKIESNQNRQFKIIRKLTNIDNVEISVQVNGKFKMGFLFPNRSHISDTITENLIRKIMDNVLKSDLGRGASYYLPAARTGFMMTKNAINQVGRKKTFDIVVDSEEYSSTEVSPFPKPIIHFLDSMDNLDFQRENKKYSQIVRWIMQNMVNGDIECVDNNSGNIQYIPSGMEQGIPLRATSGVVTELTPLILLLKYSKILKELCYEEPEMCLHPQLQFKMAKLLVRMVNSGINIVASTHSDIIVQHINNMCQLYGVYNEHINLQTLGIEQTDLIDVNNVAIYQFTDNGSDTMVERIIPKENKFNVFSFTRALKKILNQTMDVSDIIYGEED